ncbi:DoxX family protein [Aquimarina algicola]|uniref:DoxX family protein n=1 Tax=Aquimarina algicola TaxID=2589995 RepID=A0A504J4P6_9FLAO|nr:DoxX family protein [Aquimarina algicola]TPN81670.1 DoxX family protein [Aquimarina algicola]
MKKILPLLLQIVVAIILLKTLMFKFMAHPESVYIFKKVGLEPYGRIGTGITECIAGVLLLIPKTVWIGATISLGIIGGAIMMHLTKLGIEVNNDKGILFAIAVLTFILSGVILWIKRKEIKFF